MLLNMLIVIVIGKFIYITFINDKFWYFNNKVYDKINIPVSNMLFFFKSDLLFKAVFFRIKNIDIESRYEISINNNDVINNSKI
jgi:hypothetical protein